MECMYIVTKQKKTKRLKKGQRAAIYFYQIIINIISM